MADDLDFHRFGASLVCRGVERGAVRALWALAAVESVARGAAVGSSEADGLPLCLVLSGTLVVLMQSPAGKPVVFDRVAAGRVCGLFGSPVGGARVLAVQAEGSARIARLPGAPFHDWLTANPDALHNLLAETRESRWEISKRIYDMSVHDVQTRVRLFLVRLFAAREAFRAGGVLDPAPSHSGIAAHVGANREAVSRVMSRLNRAEVLDSGRQRIVLRDPAGLEAGLE